MRSLYSLLDWISYSEAVDYLKELLPGLHVSEKHIRSLLEQGKLSPYVKWGAFVDLRYACAFVSIPSPLIIFYHVTIKDFPTQYDHTKVLKDFVEAADYIAETTESKSTFIYSDGLDEYLQLDIVQTFASVHNFFVAIDKKEKVLPILLAPGERVAIPVTLNSESDEMTIGEAVLIASDWIFYNLVFKRAEIDFIANEIKNIGSASTKSTQSKIFDGISNDQFLESLGLLALMIAETDSSFKKSDGKLNAIAIRDAVQAKANEIFNQHKGDKHKGLSNLNKTISKAVEQINKNIF